MIFFTQICFIEVKIRLSSHLREDKSVVSHKLIFFLFVGIREMRIFNFGDVVFKDEATSFDKVSLAVPEKE